MNILNTSKVSVGQCVQWAKNKKATELFISIVPILHSTAVKEGVDPVLVVAQCAKETGYCRFGGVLDASFKNTCGLKIPQGGGCTDPNAHMRFNSWEDGALAQVQHLALYAGKKGYPLANPIDPRHFSYLHGKCKTVASLSGNWAGATYGQDLEKMMNDIINTKYVEESCSCNLEGQVKKLTEENDKLKKEVSDLKKKLTDISNICK